MEHITKSVNKHYDEILERLSFPKSEFTNLLVETFTSKFSIEFSPDAFQVDLDVQLLFRPRRYAKPKRRTLCRQRRKIFAC